jgi:ribosomal protein L39E
MTSRKQAFVKRLLFSKMRRNKNVPVFIFLKKFGLKRGAKAVASGKALKKIKGR